MPQVTVTGDDAVALSLQGSSSLIELVPVAGAGADSLSDDSGIIGAEDVLGDGTAVDESAAGCLVAQSNDFTVGGTGADIDGVLSDVSLGDVAGHIDAQRGVGSCVLGGVALSVLQDESCLSAVQVGSVSAACCQSLVQSGLVQAVGGSDDGGLDLVLLSEVGIQFQIAVDHVGNFIGEGPQVQNGLAFSGGGFCSGGLFLGSFSSGSIGLGFFLGRCATAGDQGQCHGQNQQQSDQFFHLFFLLKQIFLVEQHC